MTDIEPSRLRFKQRHRLALALEEAGIEPQDMARLLHVHRNTMSNWLRGKTRPPYSVLVVWAQLCHVDLNWLVEDPVTDNPGSSDNDPTITVIGERLAA